MKTVILGDIHGTNYWQTIINFEKPDRVVFVGDYFDSFDIPYDKQIDNFLDLIEYKEKSGGEVILLIGNHDYHYLPYINDTYTSGYQSKYAHLIKHTVEKNLHHLQIAYQFDDFLITHAGVSEEFMDTNFDKWSEETIVEHLNDLFKYKPNKFLFNGLDPYGDDTYQTPIWIRPRSLMRANNTSELKRRYVQVVGHTQVKEIDTKGGATGGRYYFIDCLPTSGQYMIVDEDSFIDFKSYRDYDKEDTE